MIETRTVPIDAYGHCARCYEIAAGVFRDANTGALFITDGENTLAVRVTPAPDQA